MTIPDVAAQPAHRGAAMPSGRDQVWRNWAAVVGLAVLALLAFTKLGDEVKERETFRVDVAMRSWVLDHQSPSATAFFQAVSTIGSVTPLICVAVAAAIVIAYRGRPLVAATVLVAPAAAVVAYLTLKNLFARARPSGIGTAIEGTYSFPSAHATTSAAICCTLAYVFWRERLVNGSTALLFGLFIPLLVGVSRVYLDVHWTTDVLGGWSAGVVVAALSAALYNSGRLLQARRHSTREGA